MVEPEDFGLSPPATLARVADTCRPARHGSFWKAWLAALYANQPQPPRLLPREEPDLSDPTTTHEFRSARDVRIGCALLLPRGRPSAALVTLHGYENVPTLEESAARWRTHVDRGTVILCLRVRGYRGSQADVPSLAEHAGGTAGGQWITYGLEVPISDAGYGCDWVFSYAVADVVNACRALRSFLDRRADHSETEPPLPIFLHGESFGAALGIIAAAQLVDRDPAAAPIRMAIGVPSMGDWPWRLAQPALMCRGTGGIIRRFIAEHPWLEPQVIETLRMFDTTLHARRIRCPVLCKLALRDDIVPAPTAAAIFNALGTDPGLKWRFVTRYGHFDGGIADLRRHAAFERLVDVFLDPVSEPSEAAIATG